MDRPLASSLNYGVLCHAIGAEKTCIHAALQKHNEDGKGFYIRTPQNGVLLRNKTGVPPFRRYTRFVLCTRYGSYPF